MQDLKQLEQIDQDIRRLREIAARLKAAQPDFPALVRNADRILASARMLELNVCDLLDLAAD
jgi:ABC-type transporter Mla subunit MlaD